MGHLASTYYRPRRLGQKRNMKQLWHRQNQNIVHIRKKELKARQKLLKIILELPTQKLLSHNRLWKKEEARKTPNLLKQWWIGL